jgi:two-component system chemotaxis response regulator CheB
MKSTTATQRKIRVLIVDDSALVRDILSKGLSADSGIDVVGTAPDVYAARDKIVELRPDVLTLDIEMPRMDGVEFLRRLMPQYPLPVVVVSSLTQKGKQITLDALEAGAVDFVPKPTANVAQGLQAMMMELRTKIKIASMANVAQWKHKDSQLFGSAHQSTHQPHTLLTTQTNTALRQARFANSNEQSRAQNKHALAESTDKVIAIGASTGGTEAIRKILKAFPRTMPGVVVVQHMPPGFTKSFAERLNEECMMEVKEAQTGDRIMIGRVLIAPGDFHMHVIRSGGRYEVVCRQGEKVSGHRPSVDVLMESVANNVGSNSFGILLTGMGADGAKGLKAMRDAGSMTIAQDEESCVVFGMPKVAIELGAAERVVSLSHIAQTTIHHFIP